jgi:magnesium transporter
MSQWGFYNIKDYVDFENLDLARVLYKEELDIFLHDYSIVQEIGMDLDDMYNTGVKDNWRTIPIINSEPGGIHFKENFPKTLAMIETCRGITNFAMNFTKPNGVIVPHQDPYDIIDGEEIKHYNCVAGVVIPSILDKMKIDPALSGSVILTTVTDIVGFVTFLGLGSLLLL